MLSDRLKTGGRDESGSATVEQVGILLMLATIFATLIAIQMSGVKDPPGHGLGLRIANRIACGPREPGVCRQHPTVSAYGWDLARAVRSLAPEPLALASGDGVLLAPVDFRYCQRSSCAVPTGDGLLTTANRRLTLFTQVDRLGEDRGWRITYWFYRPSLGWTRLRRLAGAAEIAAASGTRLRLEDSPRLVPLEILPGRNHYDLPPGDEPPWRWQIQTTHRGRSV